MSALPKPDTTTLDEFLDDLEAEMEITPSQIEIAERSYNSVGDWLNRPGSKLAVYEPQVYVQGSFRLGTAIKPIGDGEDFDVDAVCELRRFTKLHGTQRQLKTLLGVELEAYARGRNMQKPIEERRRCWTLNYADEAQFHLDLVPAQPNGAQQRALLEARSMSVQHSDTAIAITDNEHPRYDLLTDEWPRSNPKGYSEWFKYRMAAVFEKRRRTIAVAKHMSVEQIPDYKVKTPLQSAIKFLKRHRDMMFAGDMCDAPISIIITTLSAHAYQGEESVSAALVRILTDMDKYIDNRTGVSVVTNPSDPFENFADKWREFPARRDAFFEWLERARTDFAAAANAYDRNGMGKALTNSLGTGLTQRALARRVTPTFGGALVALFNDARELVLHASHRRRPQWPQNITATVRIDTATFSKSGFRPTYIQSGSQVERSGSLRFEANTNVQEPFKVYWQIVNTGSDAERARGLRGTFEHVERGGLTKTESTLYRGTHAIECFIVRRGVLVARSGQFIVKIG